MEEREKNIGGDHEQEEKDRSKKTRKGGKEEKLRGRENKKIKGTQRAR